MVEIIRDIRYILKRVIIGVLVGIGIFIFKDKVVFAESLTFGNVKQCAVYHFKPCTINDDTISCGRFINDWFDLSIDIEYGTGCNNSYGTLNTDIVPNEDVSIILHSIDYTLYTSDQYPIDRFNYYNNNSYSHEGSINYYVTNNTTNHAEGYMPLPFLNNVNGIHSILGARPYYCQYFDVNAEIYKDCLPNMSYDSNYNNNYYYSYLPVINYNVPNNIMGNYNWITYSYGYNGSIFVDDISNFEDHFQTNPLKQVENIEPYPLAYYTYENASSGIILPRGGNGLSTSLSFNRNGNNFTYLGDIPEPPIIDDEPELTPEQQEIIDDVNEMFSQFTPELWENISNNSGNLTEVTGQLSTLLATPYATGFSGLLDELFTGWIDVFDDYISPNAPDLWEGNTVGLTNYNYCYGSYLDGSALGPHKLRLWEYKDGNSYRYFELNLPCLTDYYSKIVSPSGLYGFPQFYSIYRTIVDGLLAYWVIIQLLQFYKYVLEPKNSKIEVLDI